MFLDRVKITIKAGNGGNGVVSLLHNAQTQYGGPDGGDGGKGGDIIFIGKPDLNTLYSFKFKKKFFAQDGSSGGKRNKTGKDGENLYIEVPLGTVIYNAENNKVIADIVKDGQTVKVLTGGQGGKGNAFFKSSVRQTPKFSKAGEIVNPHEVILELKTMADVGLIGFPNVGKSTLLSTITSAKPKIADYHFTTLFPNLGVVSFKDKSFTIADIPGLIEGASEGQGLGHYFLKHVERVRLIVHLVDISSIEGRDPVLDYLIINKELKNYDERLSKLEQIIVLTKSDLLEGEDLNERVKDFKTRTKAKDILVISSITHKGLETLKEILVSKLDNIPKPEPFEIEEKNFDKRDYETIEIIKESDHEYRVSGGRVLQLIRGVVLSDPLSFSYFQSKLTEMGIIDKLKEKGLKEGDTVYIEDISFDYVD